MKTIQRLFYREISAAIVFVAVGFLALFYFFDFIDALGDIGRGNYQLHHAVLYTLLLVPGHLYELMPIAVLIGTIFVLARMAQNSEFTILRTSGLDPKRALGILAGIGLGATLFTFLLGDYVAPQAESYADAFRTALRAGDDEPARGAWLKDRDEGNSYAVHIGNLRGSDELEDVRIYAFDDANRLTSWIVAPQGHIDADGTWTLREAVRSEMEGHDTPEARIHDTTPATIAWKTNLNAGVVSVSILDPDGMSSAELFRYISHLTDNHQDASRYQYQLWKKVLYPFACLVMVMLALPFAYLHFRSGGISTKVFGGIMIGISFVVIDNMFSHLGRLRGWPPLVSAGVPSVIYLAASLGVFTWLVRNR